MVAVYSKTNYVRCLYRYCLSCDKHRFTKTTLVFFTLAVKSELWFIHNHNDHSGLNGCCNDHLSAVMITLKHHICKQKTSNYLLPT